MSEPLFYLRGKSVFQRPQSTAAGDRRAQMGFPVCEANQYVDNAEQVVTDALNLVNDMAHADLKDGSRVGDTFAAWMKRARQIMTDD